MQQEITQLKETITSLQNQLNDVNIFVQQLKASSSIPLNVDQAFRKRFGLDLLTNLTLSTKVATSENKTVDEAGSATYGVMNKPDGFVQVTVNNVLVFIPYFT